MSLESLGLSETISVPTLASWTLECFLSSNGFANSTLTQSWTEKSFAGCSNGTSGTGCTTLLGSCRPASCHDMTRTARSWDWRNAKALAVVLSTSRCAVSSLRHQDVHGQVGVCSWIIHQKLHSTPLRALLCPLWLLWLRLAKGISRSAASLGRSKSPSRQHRFPNIATMAVVPNFNGKPAVLLLSNHSPVLAD